VTGHSSRTFGSIGTQRRRGRWVASAWMPPERPLLNHLDYSPTTVFAHLTDAGVDALLHGFKPLTVDLRRKAPGTTASTGSKQLRSCLSFCSFT